MTTLLNGSGKPSLGRNQQDCLDLIREVLSEAEAGNISTIGIVACMKGGFATVMAGLQAAELNLGVDHLKKKIIGAVEEDEKRSKKNILRI